MEFICIKAPIKWCVPNYIHKKKLMDCACLCWPGRRSWLWLRPDCLFASLIERKVCVLGQSCKKIGFLMLSPMSVKPVWDQTLLKPLCCRMMLCWNELEHWTALRVCVCAMHSTSLSWASPHPFPSLLSFYILTYFKASSLCHACIWPETSYNLLTHPPAYHFVCNTAIIPPNR